jgi:hypothetical protein
VDFTLSELDPTFGDEPILVDCADSDGQLSDGDGLARLVVPGDDSARAGRVLLCC